jgi:psiF repeat
MTKPTKTLLIAICAALPFFAASANAQTTRASCDADAKAQNITGSDKQVFMKACLPSGESADEPKAAKPAKAMKSTKASKGKKAKKVKAKKSTKAKKPVMAKKVGTEMKAESKPEPKMETKAEMKPETK